MSFSEGQFYGKGKATKGEKREKLWRERLKKIAEREADFKAHPSPKEYRPKIDDPCIYRKTFFRQQDAFEYARSKSEDLHVFAYESSSFQGESSGKRMYMVCSYPHFWHYYRQMMKRGTCHHYEVIPEGAVCKLYFDLEFLTELNPTSSGDRMVDIFIKFVDFHLKRLYGIQIVFRQVLDLQSYYPGKFSRHLIYLLRGAAFKDNIHAGNFVHHICSQLMDILRPNSTNKTFGTSTEDEPCKKKLRRSGRHKPATSESLENVAKTPEKEKKHDKTDYFGIPKADLEKLLVLDRDGNDVLFVDLGVYTKNRNFRLFKSCKLGKCNELEYRSGQHYMVSTPPGTGPVEQIFLDSIITNIKFDPYLKLLTMAADKNERQPLSRRNSNSMTVKTEPEGKPLEGFSSSPYPEIDQYITSILNIGGIKGWIRRWSYFTRGELMVYEIARYRWCENIRRHHKSNNVMFLVDIKNSVYYQKCHDPMCRRINFKSDEYPLPRELLPGHFLSESNDFPVDFLEDVSDEDLLSAAESSESDSDFKNVCVYNQTKAVKKESTSDTAGSLEHAMGSEVKDNELLEVMVKVENDHSS